MSWYPHVHGLAYRNGDYEARLVGDVWRLFHCGQFVFSSTSPAALQRFVASRQTLQIPGDLIQALIEDRPGLGHEKDMRPDREARAEEKERC